MPRFEIDDKGWIRIVGDTTIGDWTLYQGIARLEENGKRYIAVSQYFLGNLPTETILEIKEI